MSKRGHNEGSLYQRADGRWAGVVSLGYEGGRRLRKCVYGDTRREVRGKIALLLSDKQRGLPVVAERHTVAEFLGRWLTDVVAPSVRPRTYTSYQQLVNLHLIPTLGRVRLAKLNPQPPQNLMNAKRAFRLSPA